MFGCEYCHRVDGHYAQCPNYKYPKTSHYCSACGQGIYSGEEYLVNDDGDYRHYDCFYDTRSLLEWFGFEVKTMECDNE